MKKLLIGLLVVAVLMAGCAIQLPLDYRMKQWADAIESATFVEVVAYTVMEGELEDGSIFRQAHFVITGNLEEVQLLEGDEPDAHWRAALMYLFERTVYDLEVDALVIVLLRQNMVAPRTGEPIYQMAAISRIPTEAIAAFLEDPGNPQDFAGAYIDTYEAQMFYFRPMIFAGEGYTWHDDLKAGKTGCG